MTVYEFTKSIPSENVDIMMKVGISNKTLKNQISIYEAFLELINNHVPKMEAYILISERFYLCDENVRKICRKFSQEIS